MAGKRDYYDILGVDRSATEDQIKRAFRRLARRYHPDVNPNDPSAEARFKEVAGAYEVLRNPDRRAQYDYYGHAVPAGGIAGDFWEEFGGFGDLFEAFFGSRRAARRPRTRRGSDLRYDLEVTLEEVASGADKVVVAERLQPCEDCQGSGSRSKAAPKACPACGGTGQTEHTRATAFGRLSTVTTCGTCAGEGTVVSDPCQGCGGTGRRVGESRLSVNVPSGLEDGVSLRIEGEGEPGERGGAPGDLYVFVHVKPHEIFQRRGRDLFCEVPIPFVTAALGGTVSIPTLEGPDKLTIPAGTQTGRTFAVRGKGLPDVRTGVRGSQHVKVRIVTPAKLTPRQRELLTQFAEEGGDQIEDEQGWFARFRNALRGED
jgi:molecular chaperone DnaJ